MMRLFKGVFRVGGLLLLVALLMLGILFAYSQNWIPFLQPPRLTMNATTILDRVQGLSQLTTTRYSFSTIITTESEMPEWLKPIYGQKQVMVAVGYVTAGVDMRAIQAGDVQVNGAALTLRLPAPALQDCILDEGKTYIAAQDTGLFARPATNVDQETRRYAIQQLRQSALEGNILSEAQTQATTAVTQFVNLLGVQSVQVTFQPAAEETVFPPSCA
jgi:Protein of unknown function (DUF4230)